jgi:hypothetical protein
MIGTDSLAGANLDHGDPENVAIRAAASIACSIIGIFLLYTLEVDQPRRFPFLSRQFLLYLPTEALHFSSDSF